MKAIKAVIDNGQIVPAEPLDMVGRYNAVVVVLDTDPWDADSEQPASPAGIGEGGRGGGGFSSREDHTARPGYDAVKWTTIDRFWTLYRACLKMSGRRLGKRSAFFAITPPIRAFPLSGSAATPSRGLCGSPAAIGP